MGVDRIAIISDIHGNVTALDKVLSDIKQRGIKRIFCLGDLIGKGPSSYKTLNMIKETCEVVLLGNWDDFMQRPIEIPEIKWHQDQLGQIEMEYLSTLPFHYDFYMSGKYVRLFHASAKSIYHRVVPMRDSYEEKLAMFDNTEMIMPLEEGKIPDVVGYGDIHAALIDPVYPQKTLFNAGSVGNSLDIPLATYVVMHGIYKSKEEGPFSLEIIRLPYDIDREMEIAKTMNMPEAEAYELELRTAKYRGNKYKKGDW